MKKLTLIIFSLILLAGCGQKIVLLPDLDGHVGEVTVTPHSGEAVTLTQANQAVSSKNDVYTMTEAEVQDTFGEALQAQPEPTARFRLYFLSDSAKLTVESEKMLSEIMESYRARSSTDVSIIGHTDTVGEKQYNYDLSLRRALSIKKKLIEEGMPADIIQTTSHGETNPLIPTPDGKREPRNRRVEVLVR